MDSERENKLIEKQLGLVRYRASSNPDIDLQSKIPDRVYRRYDPEMNNGSVKPKIDEILNETPLGWILDMLD